MTEKTSSVVGVNNNYRITRRIGGGSFGEIYLGIGPSGEKVAVKFERVGTRCPQLRHEYKVYRELIACHGFCSIKHFGSQDNYTVMAMDLLGPSIEDLFNKCHRKFSLKTVLQIADQMLERIDTMHARHLIHRDIKPANFVVGLGDQANTIFCVDFGLSKRYRHPKNLHHMPYRDSRSLTGTPRYASINNHLGVEQSRRDDLESLAYVFIYLLNGSLPWQGLKAKNPQKKYRLILEKKQDVPIQHLCHNIPREFGDILAYARGLGFDTKPDIPRLRKMLRDCYHAYKCHMQPGTWDWDGLDLEEFLKDKKDVVSDRGQGLHEDGGVGGANGDVWPDMDPNANDRRGDTGGDAAQGIRGISMEEVAANQAEVRPTTSGAVAGANLVSNEVRPGTAWYGEDAEAEEDIHVHNGEVDNKRRGPSHSGRGDAGGNELGGMALAMQRAHDRGLVTKADVADAAAVSGPGSGVAKAGSKSGTASGPGAGGENDAHVVAGARAMMRYRRQRGSGGEQSPYASNQKRRGQRSTRSSEPFYAGSGQAQGQGSAGSGSAGYGGTSDMNGLRPSTAEADFVKTRGTRAGNASSSGQGHASGPSGHNSGAPSSGYRASTAGTTTRRSTRGDHY